MNVRADFLQRKEKIVELTLRESGPAYGALVFKIRENSLQSDFPKPALALESPYE